MLNAFNSALRLAPEGDRDQLRREWANDLISISVAVHNLSWQQVNEYVQLDGQWQGRTSIAARRSFHVLDVAYEWSEEPIALQWTIAMASYLITGIAFKDFAGQDRSVYLPPADQQQMQDLINRSAEELRKFDPSYVAPQPKRADSCFVVTARWAANPDSHRDAAGVPGRGARQLDRGPQLHSLVRPERPEASVCHWAVTCSPRAFVGGRRCAIDRCRVGADARSSPRRMSLQDSRWRATGSPERLDAESLRPGSIVVILGDQARVEGVPELSETGEQLVTPSRGIRSRRRQDRRRSSVNRLLLQVRQADPPAAMPRPRMPAAADWPAVSIPAATEA